MASSYIDITGTASRLASMTRSLADQARDMQENTAKIKRIMDTTLDDPDITLDTSFVTLGGLLGITSGKAKKVYTLLTNFQVVIQKANYDEFIDKLG